MTEKVKNTEKNQAQLIIVGIVLAVVIIVGAVIAFQNSSQSGSFSYDNIPMDRTEDGAFILGNPDAEVTLVAFEDFLCPHCQSYQPEVHQILEQYVATGKVRFEFRMLPISQISPVPFQLAECANTVQPGSFWLAHDTLFRIASTYGPQSFTGNSPRQFAEEMNLGYNALLDCMKTASQYQSDQMFARRFSEVTGTPTVGVRINGSEPRFDLISRRPSANEVGRLLATIDTIQ